MGPSLCKVNCCEIRLQRALYVLILPEFLLEFSGKTQHSILLIILQPSGGTLPYEDGVGKVEMPMILGRIATPRKIQEIR